MLGIYVVQMIFVVYLYGFWNHIEHTIH